MKAIGTRVTKGVQVGTRLRCIDNTGAKELKVIAVKGYKGVRRRRPSAGVGDVVVCTVTKGKSNMVHEVVWAVVTTQAKEYRRVTGERIKFEENTAVLINEKFEPRGKEIKGVVAREAVERFPAIGKIASMIV